MGGCVLPDYAVGTGGGGAAASGGATSSQAGSGGATTWGSGGAGGVAGDTDMTGGTDTTGTTDTGTGATGGGGGSTGPTCGAGSVCAPDAPAGWTHLRYVEAPYTAVNDGDACPNGALPTSYFFDPSLSDCKSCYCSWKGDKCSEPELSCYFGSATCGGTPTFSLLPTGSDCVGSAAIPKNVGTVGSCMVTAPPTVLSAGACDAGQPGQKNAMWQKEVHVCPVTALAAQMCPGGQCVPDGSASYPGPLCVRSQGDKACPAGWNGSKLVVYEGGDDGRTCSACQCGPATTTCSSGVYNVFDDVACAGSAVSITGAGCKPIGATLSGDARSIKPPIINAITTYEGCFGGFPDGSVQPEGPWTICCPPAGPA